MQNQYKEEDGVHKPQAQIHAKYPLNHAPGSGHLYNNVKTGGEIYFWLLINN